jgi:hypothetical protein
MALDSNSTVKMGNATTLVFDGTLFWAVASGIFTSTGDPTYTSVAVCPGYWEAAAAGRVLRRRFRDKGRSSGLPT